MPSYRYVARHIKNRSLVKGTVAADDLNQANQKIRELGLNPLQVKQNSLSIKFTFERKKVSLRERIIFTRQLAVMTKAGLPLVNALKALRRQTESSYFKKVIDDITEEVRGGAMLSRVMSRYPKVFPEIYIAVVRAGEQTGQLSGVLFRLADQQEKQAELIAKVKGALMYPAIILIALIGVVFLIVFFVLPSLEGIFKDLGADLPLTTKLLFTFSSSMRKYFYIWAIVLFLLFLGARYWFNRPIGRQFWDRLRLRVPVFGNLTKKVYMASFAHTMAMLTRASLPIIESLKIVRKTINNSLYDEAFARIESQVENGRALSAAIGGEDIFPPMVSQLVSLGEESGSMESVLDEIGTFYDSEVDNLTRNLASLIEPIMLLVMGAGVGFVVASVLSPIYKLVGEF